jgi:hypothetical protein
MRLLNLPITAAVGPLATAPFYLRGPHLPPTSITLQAAFTYGSGGTTVDCWVQTSIDGVVFFDVANFHFDTTSARPIFNLSSLTPVTAQYTPTDGTLDANTCIDGLIGNLWRAKYKTVGLYAGGTKLVVDAITDAHFDLG